VTQAHSDFSFLIALVNPFIRYKSHSPVGAEYQSVRMSKNTTDGLTRSGTGYFIAVPIWHQRVSKG